MSRPLKRKKGGRGNLNVLVYSLIVLAVLLSGMAAWQRYSKGPVSELGDMLEQRTGAFMPDLGFVENWTPAGGLPQGTAAPPMTQYFCPPCQTSVWTSGRGGPPACPICPLRMIPWGLDQQGANVSPAGGMGTGNRAFPNTMGTAGTALPPPPIPATAVLPHEYRGPCTICHTILTRTAPTLAQPHHDKGECTTCHHVVQVAASLIGVQSTPQVVWQGVAAPPIPASAVKPTLIKEFGMEVIAIPGGLKVTGVMGNSHASRAGVKAGDIIIETNWAKFRDAGKYRQAVSRMTDEKNAQIKILRDGMPMNLEVMVGEGEMKGFQPIQKL